MKFRTKVKEVEAQQWDGSEGALLRIELLAGVNFMTLDPEDTWNDDPDASAACRSDLNGGVWVHMYHGDYVVVDDEGRLFPLRKALFEEQYEAWVGSAA